MLGLSLEMDQEETRMQADVAEKYECVDVFKDRVQSVAANAVANGVVIARSFQRVI